MVKTSPPSLINVLLYYTFFFISTQYSRLRTYLMEGKRAWTRCTMSIGKIWITKNIPYIYVNYSCVRSSYFVTIRVMFAQEDPPCKPIWPFNYFSNLSKSRSRLLPNRLNMNIRHNFVVLIMGLGIQYYSHQKLCITHKWFVFAIYVLMVAWLFT